MGGTYVDWAVCRNPKLSIRLRSLAQKKEARYVEDAFNIVALRSDVDVGDKQKPDVKHLYVGNVLYCLHLLSASGNPLKF